jgi:hypothetical protein
MVERFFAEITERQNRRGVSQRKTTADPGLHRTAKRNVEAVPVGEDR